MKKRFPVVLLACLVIVAFATFSFATEPDSLTTIKKEINKTDYKLDVEEIKANQLDEYSEKIENKLEKVGFNQKITSNDLTEVNNKKSESFISADVKINSEKLQSFVFTDKETKQQAVLTHRLYVNPKGEQVFVQVIYLPETDFLLSVRSSTISKDGENITDFYEETELNNLISVSPSAIPLPSFPQWMCWMGGTLGCSVYCAGIGLIAIPAGIVCGAVCGAMFLIACTGY